MGLFHRIKRFPEVGAENKVNGTYERVPRSKYPAKMSEWVP